MAENPLYNITMLLQRIQNELNDIKIYKEVHLERQQCMNRLQNEIVAPVRVNTTLESYQELALLKYHITQINFDINEIQSELRVLEHRIKIIRDFRAPEVAAKPANGTQGDIIDDSQRQVPTEAQGQAWDAVETEYRHKNLQRLYGRILALDVAELLGSDCTFDPSVFGVECGQFAVFTTLEGADAETAYLADVDSVCLAEDDEAIDVREKLRGRQGEERRLFKEFNLRGASMTRHTIALTAQATAQCRYPAQLVLDNFAPTARHLLRQARLDGAAATAVPLPTGVIFEFVLGKNTMVLEPYSAAEEEGQYQIEDFKYTPAWFKAFDKLEEGVPDAAGFFETKKKYLAVDAPRPFGFKNDSLHGITEQYIAADFIPWAHDATQDSYTYQGWNRPPKQPRPFLEEKQEIQELLYQQEFKIFQLNAYLRQVVIAAQRLWQVRKDNDPDQDQINNSI